VELIGGGKEVVLDGKLKMEDGRWESFIKNFLSS